MCYLTRRNLDRHTVSWLLEFRALSFIKYNKLFNMVLNLVAINNNLASYNSLHYIVYI